MDVMNEVLIELTGLNYSKIGQYQRNHARRFLYKSSQVVFKMRSFKNLAVPTVLKNFSIVCLCCTFCIYFSAANFLDSNYGKEEERGLVFPVFTVVQFAVGLAVPVQVPNRSVVTNLGVLSNLPLPSKINQLYPYAGKGRQLTHDYLYESLTTAWNWSNSNGKECLLKTICQVSGMNSEKGELIFDVLRLLFSPSSLKFPVAKTHYMIAEQIGKTSNRSCAEIYPLCSHSIIDLMVN